MGSHKTEKRMTIGNCLRHYFEIYNFSLQVIFAIIFSCTIFAVDYYNAPSRIIVNMEGNIFWPITCAIIVIFAVCLFELRVFDLFAITSENPVDVTLTFVVLSMIFYSLFRVIFIGMCLYVQISICATFASLAMLIIRLIVRYRRTKKAEAENSNLIELKTLLEGKVSRNDNNPIFLEERDIDYDLLNRGGIIDKLYSSIKHCRPEGSYVISLEGAWGTGKTTIINNVKRHLRTSESDEKDYVIIDDFDPWLYGTQEALLLAMFEAIINHAGLKYSPIRSNMLGKELAKTISNRNETGGIIYNLFYNTRKHRDDVSKLKKRLCAYLRSQNKTIVFFVDNLDRASDANVIFLFKLIGIVFDLPGIVYVLSFERERIDAILKNTQEIDPRFTEKIIQQEIKVPAISAETAEQIYSICIDNLLLAYGITRSELKDYAAITKYIVAMTQNVRAFKRMLNSVFSAVFCDDTLLFKRDLLAIEVIHFYDPVLYSSIYANAKYYISHERDPVEHLYISVRKDEFNNKAKEYFSEMFDTREKEKTLLKDIFPSLKRYTDGQAIIYDGYFPDPDAAEIAKNARICDAKYFDLYFSYAANKSLRIKKYVTEFVSNINMVESTEDAIALTRGVFRTLEYEHHKEWLERFQNHLADIGPLRVYDTVVGLYSTIFDMNSDRTMLGYGLGTRERAEYIISELILNCNEVEFENFLSLISADYDKLRVISSILRWLKNDKNDDSEVRKQRANRLHSKYAEICNRVIEEKINIYSDDYYREGNAWGLYYYHKENEIVGVFTNYIKSITSAKTIYRVMWDIKTVSVGRGYQYSLTDENLRIFIDDSTLEKLLEENPPKNEDEKFISQMYDVYRNGEPDEFGHKGVSSASEVALKL